VIVSLALTVPAGTAVEDAERREIKLAEGSLVRVRFDVPPGANGEVYLRVLHLEDSIVPDVTDQWIPLTGGVLDFAPGFSDWQGVFKLQLEGCSPGALYSHTIECQFEVDEGGGLVGLFERFIGLGF